MCELLGLLDALLLPCVTKWRLGPVGACSAVFLGTKIKIATTGDSQIHIKETFFFFKEAVESYWNPDKNKIIF